MGIFNRKRSAASSGGSGASSPSGGGDGLQFNWSAKADPADLDNVRSEWNMENSDYQDPRAWGNGMRLFETGPPAQQFNAAEYMSRGFCNVLFDPNHMDDESVAVTIERMLLVFDRGPITDDLHAEMAAKRIRLALAVLRERGWQPAALGGNGRMNVSLDTPRIRASLSCDGVAPEKSLEHFFGLA